MVYLNERFYSVNNHKMNIISSDWVIHTRFISLVKSIRLYHDFLEKFLPLGEPEHSWFLSYWPGKYRSSIYLPPSTPPHNVPLRSLSVFLPSWTASSPMFWVWVFLALSSGGRLWRCWRRWSCWRFLWRGCAALRRCLGWRVGTSVIGWGCHPCRSWPVGLVSFCGGGGGRWGRAGFRWVWIGKVL